mgnify:CR=1 FL=1
MATREDRLQEELRFHLDQQVAKNLRQGMSPDEARRSALVKFGGVETFALGIGAAVAMFSVFEGVLLRPLALPEPDRVVRLFQIMVGVMPDGFDYPVGNAMWIPREQTPPQTGRSAHNFQVIGRLADGVPLARAQAELSALSRQLKTVHGDNTRMVDAAVLPLLEIMTGASRPTLQLLLAASLLLLLAACTNVSNLLMVRAGARRSECAVQLAMGATAGRLGRQLLAEPLVVCLAGAALGIAAATTAVRLFVAMGPSIVRRLDEVSVNGTALLFALSVSVLAALALSLVTAAGARSVRITDALSESTRSGTGSRRQIRAREGLIVTQVARRSCCCPARRYSAAASTQ